MLNFMLIMRPNVCLLDTPNPINLEDISTSKFYLRSTLLLQYRFETSLIQEIAALLLHLPSDTDFKVGDYLHTNILDTPVYSIYLYLFLSDILSVRRCMFLFKLMHFMQQGNRCRFSWGGDTHLFTFQGKALLSRLKR